VEVPDNFTSNFELRPLCPEYNPDIHSIVNVCGACFESAGGLVNSTIHRIWMFVGNVSNEEPTQIPYVIVPLWFRSDPSLLDDLESPIPANRELWSRSRPRKKRRLSADNELDRDLGAAFAQIEMVGAREAMTGADGADRVSTGHDGVLAWSDGVEIRGVILVLAQEQSKLLADVAAYKAQISFLESKLSELGFR
jgi:hypothetical protein